MKGQIGAHEEKDSSRVRGESSKVLNEVKERVMQRPWGRNVLGKFKDQQEG